MPIPPSVTLMFDSNLNFAVDLVKASLKAEGNQSDAIFMKDVFDDFIKGFFGTLENIPINVDLYDNPNQSFNEIFDQDITLRDHHSLKFEGME